MPAPRTTLARLPTPVQRLERLGAQLGVDLWVKRDDLTGFGLSGNKVRKLEWLLADAEARGATAVITTGGVQSNHARATAVAARQRGLRPILLLRGAPPAVPDGNLLLDRLVGAEVHWCTPEQYRTERDVRMRTLAGACVEPAYVIPEGGSNAVGSRGFVEAAGELSAQAPEGFDHVVLAVGSGGTLAGLVLGDTPGEVVGIAVCDDTPTFVDIVHRIADEAGRTVPAHGRGWRVLDAHRGEAYGVADGAVWATMAEAARTEGLLLDPTYTGKALHGLRREVEAGRLGGRILFWHTGGAFGLFGRGAEVPGGVG